MYLGEMKSCVSHEEAISAFLSGVSESVIDSVKQSELLIEKLNALLMFDDAINVSHTESKPPEKLAAAMDFAIECFGENFMDLVSLHTTSELNRKKQVVKPLHAILQVDDVKLDTDLLHDLLVPTIARLCLITQCKRVCRYISMRDTNAHLQHMFGSNCKVTSHILPLIINA